MVRTVKITSLLEALGPYADRRVLYGANVPEEYYVTSDRHRASVKRRASKVQRLARKEVTV